MLMCVCVCVCVNSDSSDKQVLHCFKNISLTVKYSSYKKDG